MAARIQHRDGDAVGELQLARLGLGKPEGGKQGGSGQATLSLFTPPRRGTLPAVRAFADYLLKELPPAVSR